MKTWLQIEDIIGSKRSLGKVREDKEFLPETPQPGHFVWLEGKMYQVSRIEWKNLGGYQPIAILTRSEVAIALNPDSVQKKPSGYPGPAGK